MSTTDQTALGFGERRFAPEKVRLSSEIVNDLCFWRRRTGQIPTAGLLFGTAKGAIVCVTAFQCLEDAQADRASSGNPTAVGLHKLLVGSNTLPELRNLELLGWFSVQSSLELLQGQLEFHYRHFRRACDLALLMNSADESRFSGALYTKLPGSAGGTHNLDYGLVRLSAVIPVTEPLEVRTSPETPPELYAEVCRAADALDRVQNGLAWKQAVFSVLGMKRASRSNGSAERLRFFAKVNADALSGTAVSTLLPHAPVAGAPKLSNGFPPEPTGFAAHSGAASEPNSAGSARNLAGASFEPKSRWFSFFIALVVALSFGVGFGIVRLLYPWPKESQSYSANGLRNSTEIDLKLQVLAQADRLQVGWDRQNPLVRSAARGQFQVIDGSQNYRIRLDSAQIRQGVLLYKPSTADVIFELEIADDHGRTANATIRYVDGTHSSRTDALDSKQLTDVPVSSAAGTQESKNAGSELVLAQSPMTGKGSYGDNLQRPSAFKTSPAISANSNRSAVLVSSSTPPGSVNKSPFSSPIFATAPAPISALEPKINTEINSSLVPLLSSRQNVLQLPNLSLPPSQNGSQSKMTPNFENLRRPADIRDVTDKRTVSPATLEANSKAVYVPPVPLREAMPDHLGRKIILYKNIDVEVKVTLDALGHVEQAHVENSAKNLNLALIGVVTTTAKQWRFRPATRGGQPVPSEYVIIFHFSP